MVATMKGKVAAQTALQERRETNKGKKPHDNSRDPAGSPMIFMCLGCGDDIVVGENYVRKPSLCRECAALKELGWLE
jgi:hypothetical protein